MSLVSGLKLDCPISVWLLVLCRHYVSMFWVLGFWVGFACNDGLRLMLVKCFWTMASIWWDFANLVGLPVFSRCVLDFSVVG